MGNSSPASRGPAKRDQLRRLAFAALIVAGLVTSGCGAAPAQHQLAVSRPGVIGTKRLPTAIPTVRPAPLTVYGVKLLYPAVTVTSSGTYVAWQLSPPASPAARSELARIDPGTGRILASRKLGAFVGQVLLAAGTLWVVAASPPSRVTLLKLNPRTLTQASAPILSLTLKLPSMTLTVAGGWLWIDIGNRLLRLSLPAGRLTRSVPLPGAASSDVSADPSGTSLIDSEADSGGGKGSIQRRDPVTGALLASHPILFGVAAPLVTGPIDSVVWMTEPTGMQGYVEAFSSSDLAVIGSGCHEGAITRTCVPGDNGITARMADGLVWVTQQNGGNARNYCAAAGTGEVLAPIRLPRPAQDEVLAIGAGRIFYAARSAGVGSYLHQEAVPTACRG